jgi:hypothetical protein
LQTTEKNSWELLSHPPYSTDFAPSDYHLLVPLKDHHYETNEAVQEAVRSWLRGSETDFYCRGTFKIMKRSEKCRDRDGDFVEK